MPRVKPSEALGDGEYATVGQVATFFRADPAAVLHLVNSGELPHVKVAGLTRLSTQAMREIADGTHQPSEAARNLAMVRYYLEGYTIRETAETFSMQRKEAHEILDAAGVIRRPGGKRSNKSRTGDT
jgi:hypothetical protein